MPQTREHLAICSLLHIKSGLVALTKTDMVEPDWLRAGATTTWPASCGGTFLAGAPDRPGVVEDGRGAARAAGAPLARWRAPCPRKAPTRRRACPSTACSPCRASAPWSRARSRRVAWRVDERVEVYPRGGSRECGAFRCTATRCRARSAGQRTAVNLQGVERDGHRAGRRGRRPPGRSCRSVLVDATRGAAQPTRRGRCKPRDRVRFHVGTQRGDGARAAASSETGARRRAAHVRALPAGGAAGGAARRPLRDPLLLADRHHRRRDSARRRAAALQAQGARASGPPRRCWPRARRPTWWRSICAKPARQARGSSISAPARRSVPSSSARSARGAREVRGGGGGGPRALISTGTRATGSARATLGLLGGLSRRAPAAQRGHLARGAAQPGGQRAGTASSPLLTALESEGVVRSERDQVRLASHSIRLSPEQQRVVDGVEADFRRRRRRAAGVERRRSPGLASRARSSTSSSSSSWPTGSWSGCKESLYFHAAALQEIQDTLVAHLQGQEGAWAPPT